MIVLFLNCISKGISKSWNILINSLYNSLFRTLLWTNNVSIGSNLKVKHAIPSFWRQYGGHGEVVMGDNVTFIPYGDQSYNSKCKLMVEKDATLIIGHHSGFNGVLIYCQESITIGNYVKVGGGTRIFDTDHHPLNWKERRTSDVNTKHAPIVIEDDVFIGAGCYIMKGVTIGARSIIAAGSVVVKSIPADCVAGGNPCRIIKQVNSQK